MAKYILKRIAQTVVVIIIVAIATFFLTSLIPSDPVYVIGGEDLTQEQYDAIYYSLGLDKPLPVRFFNWAANALKGDFGTSYVYHQPVWKLIGSRVTTTLYFSFLSMLISIPIGILFGMITAVKRGKKADTIITLLANISLCLPQFWIGICLLFIFGLKMRILPTYGFDWPWKIGLGEHLKLIIMPLICLSLGGIASFTRQTRSSMLEVIRQDFVRTARSKGLKEKKVIFKHIMRNGLIPVITMFGNRLAFMIGGSMFVENVFAIPGMGTLMLKCINGSDLPTIQALVLITTAVSCVAYILTDLLYVIVDPRISLTSDQSN